MLIKLGVLYGAQTLKALLPLVFVPLILDITGPEQYGLVSLLALFIGLLGLLDAGVSGGITRLVAIHKNDVQGVKKVFSFYLKVFCVLFAVAILLFTFVVLSKDLIENNWLKSNLKPEIVSQSLLIMGFILFVSYLKTYLTSFLNGLERQVPLAYWSVTSTLAYYFGSYLGLVYSSGDILVYFLIMLVVSVIDFLVVSSLVLYYYSVEKTMLAKKNVLNYISSSYQNENIKVRDFVGTTIHLSGLSLLWVVATQVDKLVLTKYIPLEEFAYYQIATQVSLCLGLFTVPLTQFLLPRLSSLFSNGDSDRLSELFTKFFLAFIAIVTPIIPLFFLCGAELIYVWIGSRDISENVNGYAKWLISSAYFYGITNFLFIILFAVGKLKYHFRAYSLYSLLTIPLSVIVAMKFGGEGSAFFIFLHSMIFMFFWSGFVLNSLIPKLIKYGFMVFTASLLSSVSILILNKLVFFNLGVVWFALTSVACCALASVVILHLVFSKYKSIFIFKARFSEVFK
ncbi:lipopolysaccharide biosynthesis protein [Rheinheimera mangrovi]|uniref:lipopolysaccharide biosynthesis protein n=1 Tax=Rheinheimera mangrovi TaxID=2498451 RepID=UPI000F8E3082|nr:oligosaccharide flippase family protein [Rheinheimera mangrovi]